MIFGEAFIADMKSEGTRQSHRKWPFLGGQIVRGQPQDDVEPKQLPHDGCQRTRPSLSQISVDRAPSGNPGLELSVLEAVGSVINAC
jgi:hypothetical protein